jgi:endonuclease YncB( thermonuclease family)
MKRLLIAFTAGALLTSVALADPMVGVGLRITQRVFQDVTIGELRCTGSVASERGTENMCGRFAPYEAQLFGSAVDSALLQAARAEGLTVYTLNDWKYSGTTYLRLYHFDSRIYSVGYNYTSGVVLVSYLSRAESATILNPLGSTSSASPASTPSAYASSSTTAAAASTARPATAPVTVTTGNGITSPSTSYEGRSLGLLSATSFTLSLPEFRQDKLRLVGVEVPEVVRQQATSFLSELISGMPLKVVTGPQLRDSEGFVLVYAFTQSAQSKFVNAEILRAGLGRLTPVGTHDLFANELAQAENEARAAGRGIWKK